MGKTKLIGLDCGETSTGIAIVTEGGISSGYNISNQEVFNFIMDQQKELPGRIELVIEDVRPYNMRITDGIIKTIKFIGQMEWRLQEAAMDFKLIPRWEVKHWVFERFREMAEPEIEKKIDYSRERKKKLGQYVKANRPTPTFIYVDDRIVQKAMRILWNIPKQRRVGQKAPFNLKDHSWQALAVISRYIVLCKPSFLWNRATV